MASPNANMVGDDDETQTLNASQLEHKTGTPGGEIYGGPSGGPWSMYLTETEKKDKEMVERWKGEADSALIFAGLFSAVVTVSLVESYKFLSPDPGDETVRLLTQLSGQLVNISNGIPLESTVAGPFKPSTSAVLVNLTWFCSMALCFSCSVAATITQQCARQYLVLTQGSGAPYERARLRTFLFNGLKRFQVDRVLQVLAMAMHFSILLYAVGILSFIFLIDSAQRMIGFVTLSIVIILGLIYATFTLLPLFFFDCPYATPYSALM
ncbi:hypothetical protein BJY52DRAFT_1150035, partial [Lactarius psammicola]